MASKAGYLGRDPSLNTTVVSRQLFSPTGVQTSFTFSSGYEPGYIDVFLNGLRMVEGQDYTAGDTQSIVLNTPATSGDVLEAQAYKTFNVGNQLKVGIQSVGNSIGTVDTINFIGAGNTFSINGSTVDVSIGNVTDITGTAGGLSGTPDITVGSITASGVVTATTFDGNATTATNASGLTGTPDITVGIVTATAFTGHSYIRAPHGTTQNFSVTVAAKTAAHRYNGTGSSNGYVIDGVESPFLTLTPGRTYRFTLSSSDMASHPFRFYEEADKTTAYTTNVTSTATYTEITVTDSTPEVLHYQCSAHAYMGNAVNTNTNASKTGINNVSGTAIFSGGTVEKFENAGTTLGSQTNNPLTDGNVILFTGNESGNLTINFTGVHSTISSGQNVSYTIILTPNNSGKINAVQIDGVAQTVQYSNGVTPVAGSSGRDVYTYTILKTGSGTTDYVVLGAVTNFA